MNNSSQGMVEINQGRFQGVELTKICLKNQNGGEEG